MGHPPVEFISNSSRPWGALLPRQAPLVWGTRQKRFYDFNVWSGRKVGEKLEYMHQNPVKRGLVESPELWAWSSYRAYALGEAGPAKLNDWPKRKFAVR